MEIQFTAAEAPPTGVPFLLNADLVPLTAPNAWLRSVASSGATSSAATWRTYGQALLDFFQYLEAHGLDWKDVDQRTLLAYRRAQEAAPSKHTGRHVSRSTIQMRLLVACRFYAWASEQGFLPANPVRYREVKIRRPRDTDLLAHVPRTATRSVPEVAYERLGKCDEVRWLPHEQVMQWINSIRHWRDKLMAKLLYRSGMRRAELLTLQTSAIPERKSIDVSRSEVSFEIRGKGGRWRPVYVATRDLLALHDYIAVRRRAVLKERKLAHDAIWISERTAQPLRVEALNEIFAAISARCGINVTPHMLRHSWAVLALAHFRDVGHVQPEKLLQIRLGHASLTTTNAYYMHATPDQLAKDAHAAASLIERLLECDLDAAEQVRG